MAKASRSSIQGALGRGEGFGIGTGGHPSVLKSHKTRQGASRNHAKARRSSIQGVLGGGEGFGSWGGLWDRDRGRSVSFQIP